ncbi:uncharacterized protein FIBRA_03120 [Fibroporia radiculosa]|uniref:Uncharacterized protein n=1 Tax=Fibroporia radiculosa TaxID=599839 RepID=J4HVT5_9APHY|nr:uncharacterized protein FIBRA_03120 [Fibroporia radiculosa]CCM01072.1 predicted protein [Fibroporia radiculosa]
MDHAWNAYARQLLPLGFGHPLFFPEPSRKQGQIELGDVGWIVRGSFRRLLNVTKPATDPVNRFRHLGHPIQTLPIESQRVAYNPAFIQNDMLCNQSVTHPIRWRSLSRATKLNDATLVLPEHAAAMEIAEHGAMVDHIRRNYDYWHHLASSAGLALAKGELIFVSGWAKACAYDAETRDWASCPPARSVRAQLHSQGRRSQNFMRKMHPDEVHSDETVGPEREIDVVGTSKIGHGEDREPSTVGDSAQDKCIFVHYYKAKKREHNVVRHFWARLSDALRLGGGRAKAYSWIAREGTAGLEHMPLRVRREQHVFRHLWARLSDALRLGGGRTKAYSWIAREGTAGLEHMPLRVEYDPVSLVLDYILNRALSVNVAVASTHDVAWLCKTSHNTDVIYLLRKMRPGITVLDGGIGMLRRPDETRLSLVRAIMPRTNKSLDEGSRMETSEPSAPLLPGPRKSEAKRFEVRELIAQGPLDSPCQDGGAEITVAEFGCEPGVKLSDILAASAYLDRAHHPALPALSTRRPCITITWPGYEPYRDNLWLAGDITVESVVASVADAALRFYTNASQLPCAEPQFALGSGALELGALFLIKVRIDPGGAIQPVFEVVRRR